MSDTELKANPLPWDERVTMFQVNPLAAKPEDVIRMAEELATSWCRPLPSATRGEVEEALEPGSLAEALDWFEELTLHDLIGGVSLGGKAVMRIIKKGRILAAEVRRLTAMQPSAPTGGELPEGDRDVAMIESKLRGFLRQHDAALRERFDQEVKFHTEMGRLPKTDNPLLNPMPGIRTSLFSGKVEWIADKLLPDLLALGTRSHLRSAPDEGEGRSYDGPDWTCSECGHSGEGFRTITYSTPDGTEYDIECPNCQSTEVEETPTEAWSRVIDKLQKAREEADELRRALRAHTKQEGT